MNIEQNHNNDLRLNALIVDLSHSSDELYHETGLNKVVMARLASLMPTDELKLNGDEAYLDIDKVMVDVANNLDEKDPLITELVARHGLYELIALKSDKGLSQSSTNHKSMTRLIEASDNHTKSIGVLSLVNSQDLFSKEYLEQMPNLTAFLKGDDNVTDSELVAWAVTAKSRLDQDVKKFDDGLVADSFINLVNHKSFDALFERAAKKPNLALFLYENFGDPFANILYEHSLESPKDLYAMAMLTNSQYGFLKDAQALTQNSLYSQALLEVVVKSDNAQNNIKRITGISHSSGNLAPLVESVIDAHSTHYNAHNISTMLEDVGSKLTEDQITHISEVLIENKDNQPILPALQSLLKIGRDHGFEITKLEEITQEYRSNLKQEVQDINLPIASYSRATIDFIGTDVSIAIRDIKSVPHLDTLMRAALNTNSQIGYEVNHTQSLLDIKTAQAINNYINHGDAVELNDVLFQPILQKDEGVSYDLTQLLFEANKQNKALGESTVQKPQILADIAPNHSNLYANGDIILPLKNLYNSNEVMRASLGYESSMITIDATGLGEDYDKRLLAGIKQALDEPDNNSKQNRLNTLIGLPIALLSSKIEKSQQNMPKADNIIKKTTDKAQEVAQKMQEVIIRRPK